MFRIGLTERKEKSSRYASTSEKEIKDKRGKTFAK